MISGYDNRLVEDNTVAVLFCFCVEFILSVVISAKYYTGILIALYQPTREKDAKELQVSFSYLTNLVVIPYGPWEYHI